jgi:hypothetical protein
VTIAANFNTERGGGVLASDSSAAPQNDTRLVNFGRLSQKSEITPICTYLPIVLDAPRFTATTQRHRDFYSSVFGRLTRRCVAAANAPPLQALNLRVG